MGSKILLVLIFLFIFSAKSAFAATSYYIAPDKDLDGSSPNVVGNDNYPGTLSQPIKTFDKAWQILQPGDTLYLLDGIYLQTMAPNIRNGSVNSAINVSDYVTYPLDHPDRITNFISILAYHDGQAIIDGENQRIPVSFGYYTQSFFGHYFRVEGIVAKNSSCQVFLISGRNLIFKRISGYNAGTTENCTVLSISSGGSPTNPANILLEDSVAGGSGRKMVMAYDTNVNMIFRRVFAAWQEWQSSPTASYPPDAWPWGDGIEIYNWQQPDLSSYPGLQNSIVENSIVYGMIPTYGFSLAPNPARTQHNNFLGNMAIAAGQKWNKTSSMIWPPCTDPDGMDSTGAPIYAFGHSRCVNWINWTPHRAGFDFGIYAKPLFKNNTFRDLFATSNAMAGLAAGESGNGWCTGNEGNNHYPCSKCNSTEVSPSDNCPPGVYTNAERSVNNVLDHITLANNGIGTPVSVEGAGVEVNNYSLSMFDQFGSKSNLFIEGNPSYANKAVGARLRYRYVNGQMTTQELWPWPMEERIKSEFSIYLANYHSINPELSNFSVTNTVVPLINQYTAIQVPLTPLAPGDQNGDGKVDISDLRLAIKNFSSVFDITNVLANYGQPSP